MTDVKKYIVGKTYEELLEIQRTSVVGGDIYQAVTFEIQRIQQDTNNIQIANLIGEVQKLKDIASENSGSSRNISITAIIVSLIIGGVSIYLEKIQANPILEQQFRAERSLYEHCKEPGNWDIDDGGATPGSSCKETYIKLKIKFGAYPPAEQALNN